MTTPHIPDDIAAIVAEARESIVALEKATTRFHDILTDETPSEVSAPFEPAVIKEVVITHHERFSSIKFITVVQGIILLLLAGFVILFLHVTANNQQDIQELNARINKLEKAATPLRVPSSLSGWRFDIV